MDIVNAILLGIGIAILLYLPYIEIFCKGVPHYPTAPSVRKAMTERILKDFKARKSPGHYTVIDMGSGFGSLVLDIAKAHPEIKVIGVEVDCIGYLISKFRLWRSGLDNAHFKRGDFMKFDISKADVLMFYIGRNFFVKVEDKLKTELKDNALFFSNAFEVKSDWVKSEAVQVDTKYPHQGTFFIYKRK